MLNDRERFLLDSVTADACRKRKRESLRTPECEMEIADVLGVINELSMSGNSILVKVPRFPEYKEPIADIDRINYVRARLFERGFDCAYSAEEKMLLISW